MVNCIKSDLRQVESLEQQIPQDTEVIIHTAGFTSVEGCETYPDKAQSENSDMAASIATVANNRGIKFVHISTDHLFQGDRPMYTESSTAQPLNEYAKTKLLAETEVAKACRDALIVRTNFYGWGHQFRHSFSDWIFSQLTNKKTITMYDNIYFTPIYTRHLIEYVEQLVDNNLSGIFNVVGNERISKYDFGIKLARQFKLDESLIKRGSYSSEGVRVPRPKDMSLDNSKVSQILKCDL